LPFSQKDPKKSEISKSLIFPSGKSVRKFWNGTLEIKASPDYDYGKQYFKSIAKVSVTPRIVINVQTRELLAGETKNSFV